MSSLYEGKTGVSYHLHEKTGNPSWKIKWFALFRLGSFRKYGLRFEVMLFFCSFKSLKLMWIDNGNVAFKCLMFMPEISNRMVFVNGKHPGIQKSRLNQVQSVK